MSQTYLSPPFLQDGTLSLSYQDKVPFCKMAARMVVAMDYPRPICGRIGRISAPKY